jgi:methionine synthase I (cobalamin-dependent)
MKPTLTQLIASGKILVSDGAWGTFLQAKGLQPGECPELWNIDHPTEVLDIARSYIAAGADMIETNSKNTVWETKWPKSTGKQRRYRGRRREKKST